MNTFSSLLYRGRPLFAASIVCFAASCGFPGIKVDTSGLGTSPIATLLAHVWMNSPASISSQVAEMLKPKDPAGVTTVASAKLLGFDCGATLVSCRYSGHVQYRLLNLPAENAAQAAKKADILITITSENPLVVHTNIDTSPR